MNKVINDMSIRVATVNGTGSQSSNNILFKSLFRMGIGVCGKNLFPSNIQGLPTWFKIRVSPQGYQTLRDTDNIAVLMNPATSAQDFDEMPEGATIFYNSNLVTPPAEVKTGTNLYALPVEDLAKQITNPKLKHLLKNLFYVGALSVLYEIDYEVIKGVIADTFKSKAKAIDANIEALDIGINYAKENFQKQDPYFLEKGTWNEGKIILEGNSAAALGCVYGGCTVVAWYPITPSSSMAEAAGAYMEKFRKDADGKRKFAIVQADDELASAGMIIGAGWSGARAMTATSGPGISLMNEFIGLAYYSEVPCVFVDVQRVGPSTGLPTRTQQCDIIECGLASHGDTKHVMLLPSSLNESFDFARISFDLADRLQTPVFFVTDLDLGMNNWVDEELKYTEPKFDRGKVLSEEDLEKLKGDWGRYRDSDGDGIPYRTLPGNAHPNGAFFTRGSGHDEEAKYTESPVVYARNMDRLLKKWHTAKKYVPKPVVTGNKDAKVGIIAYGTTHHAVAELLDRFSDTPVRYMRLKAYPFTDEVEQFVKECDKVIMVEQNRDGQMEQLLVNDLPGYQDKIDSIRYYGGFPISADFIERELKEKLG